MTEPKVWIEVWRQRDGSAKVDRFAATSATAKAHRRGGGHVARVELADGRDETGRRVAWKIYSPACEITGYLESEGER